MQQIDTPRNLYNVPANVFVAGFIGSPSMNFFDATLVGEEGTLYLDTGDFRVEVPAEKTSTYDSYAGKEVVFGIRPEHIHAPAYAPPDIMAAPLSGTIDVVELLGHELHIFVDSGSNSFVATVDTRLDAGPVSELDLVMDMGNMHIFDKSTEVAVR